jgi:hypothetical protein
MDNISLVQKVHRDRLEQQVERNLTVSKSSTGVLLDEVTQALDAFKSAKEDLLATQRKVRGASQSLKTAVADDFTRLTESVGGLRDESLELARKSGVGKAAQSDILDLLKASYLVGRENSLAALQIEKNESLRHRNAMNRLAEAANSSVVRSLRKLSAIDSEIQSMTNSMVHLFGWAQNWTGFEKFFRAEVARGFSRLDIEFKEDAFEIDSLFADLYNKTTVDGQLELDRDREEVAAMQNSTAKELNATFRGLLGTKPLLNLSSLEGPPSIGTLGPAGGFGDQAPEQLAERFGRLSKGVQNLNAKVGEVEDELHLESERTFDDAVDRIRDIPSSVLQLPRAPGMPDGTAVLDWVSPIP